MLNDHLDILEQARNLLQEITHSEYVSACMPVFPSSIGEHIRHITDHYLALMAGVNDATVNYNARNRQSPVANDQEAAIALIDRLRDWLQSLQPADMSRSMRVICEVSISQTANETTESSVGRELVFLSSHSIHHFSLIAAMRRLQGGEVEEELGVAPATLSFLRRSAG